MKIERNQASVSKKGANRIRDGHLWIFKSDVLGVNAEGGSIVTVLDERRKFLGKALYSDKSEITFRFLTTQDVRIDKDWWRERIVTAVKRREHYRRGANAARLVYSEGDLLPSLIIDFYDDTFVLQTLSQGADKLKSVFVEILQEEFTPQAIIERNDVRVRELENLPLQSQVLSGEAPEEIVIEQDGVRFYVSPLGGQKTGTFLDQRENRLTLRRFAYGKALDCFTFNGGFALNLAQTCERVTAVDISADAIKLAQRNAQLNRISNVEFQTANVFDYLRDSEAAGEKFDTIVLDPPAFAKSRQSVKAAMRGYKEINLRALKLLNSNGVLATCTCSFHATEELFLEVVAEAARDANRRIQLIEKRPQASDHPVLFGMPETYYLKCLILRVLN